MTFFTTQFKDMFGRRSGDQRLADEPQDQDGETNRQRARRMFLNDITDFLVGHDLSINATNFDVAREIVTGGTAPINGLFRQLLASGDRVTDDEIVRIVKLAHPHKIGADMLHDMLDKFQHHAANVLDTSAVSQRTMASFGSKLESECAAGASGDLVERLIGLTREMVAKTAALNKKMEQDNRSIKRLNGQLKKANHAAEHDQLTGLPNRRAFERRLAEAVVEARAKAQPLAVAFCDLDHFKQINDTHGHDTGDRVLCLVAQLLTDVSRGRCHVTRHGGEEFVLLFPDRSAEDAATIVDEARLALGARRLTNKATSQPLGRVTFSGGVANVMAFSTASDALRAADEALYKAKSQGRDMVIINDHASALH